MQPWQRSTTSRISSSSRVTRASTSIVSAVPAGEVMARDEVLGIISPCAATMGATIREVRLPGMPPMQCLSTTMGRGQSRDRPEPTMARVSSRVSSGVMDPAQATRKAASSMSE